MGWMSLTKSTVTVAGGGNWERLASTAPAEPAATIMATAENKAAKTRRTKCWTGCRPGKSNNIIFKCIQCRVFLAGKPDRIPDREFCHQQGTILEVILFRKRRETSDYEFSGKGGKSVGIGLRRKRRRSKSCRHCRQWRFQAFASWWLQDWWWPGFDMVELPAQGR